MPRKGERRGRRVYDGEKWVYIDATSSDRRRLESLAQTDPTIRPTDDPEWNDLRSLRSSVDRQRNRLTGLGVEVPAEGHEKNPSVISRVFDLLQRPNYASANFFSNLVDEDKKASNGKSVGEMSGWEAIKSGVGMPDFGAALSGAWRGLQGKDKTDFDQVLGEGGIKGGWQRATLGMGLDVAMDPTTYFGTGIVGKGDKADDLAKVSARALNLGNDAIRTEQKLANIGKSAVVNKAVGEALRQARLTGKPIKVKEVIEDTIFKEGFRLAKEEETRLLAKNTPQLGIKALGREFGVPGTERTAKALQEAGRGIVDNTPLRHLSTKSLFPGDVNTFRLQHIGVSGLHTKRQLEEWATKLAPFGKEERTQISKYMRAGTKHFDPAARAAIDDVRTLMDDIADTEIKLFGNTDLIKNYDPNYLPVVWRKGSQMRTFKDPAEAMKKGWKQVEDIADLVAYKVDSFNREMGKFNLAKDLEANFGVKKLTHKASGASKALMDSNAFKTVNMPHVAKDTYFDPEIARGINQLSDFLSKDEVVNGFLSHYDNMQGKWKALTTIYNPGFHQRNLMSDMWTNMMDGLVPNPASLPYRAAWQEMVEPVAKGSHDLNPLQMLGRVPTGTGPGKAVEMIKAGKAGDRHLQELVQAYDDLGLRSGYYRAEVGGVGRSGTASRLKTPVRRVRDWSEAREDFTRFAHFIDSFVKEGKAGKTFQQATETAAEKVRKFNFDYNDFTPFEARVMKRIIPFYSWMRKNIPLQLSLLATRPGRLAIAPKGIRAIQNALGVENDQAMPGLGNLLPLWVDEDAGFLTKPGEFGKSGPQVITPDFLPVGDLGTYAEGLDQVFDKNMSMSDRIKMIAQGPIANLVQQTAPAARVPFELATGQQVFGNRPINDYAEYIRDQVLPPFRYTVHPFEDQGGGEPLTTKLLRTYGGLGTRQISPGAMTSELRRQEDRYQSMIGPAKERARQEWLKRLGIGP